MNYLKMLGFAAVVVVALMALFGANSASATVLCKNNLNTEKCSEPYPVGTEVIASLAGTALIEEPSLVLATCTESVVKSTLKEAGSATTTVTSNISTITWGGCSSTVDILQAGSSEMHWISGTDNGTFVTSETTMTINIGLSISCTYGSGLHNDVGMIEGGNPGSLLIAGFFAKTAGSVFCPSLIRLRAKYTVTNPTNVWVAAS